MQAAPLRGRRPAAPYRGSQLDRIRAHGAPLGVTIEVTHRCHLACNHCYLHDNHQWQDKARELSTAELCGVVDQLPAAGCLFLTLTGGEVFLRDDILTVARHARRLGLNVTLYTTGTLLTERRLRALAELHLNRVELSLYSTDAAVHDGITGRPGSHAKTMSALHSLRRHGVRVLIKCPVMQQNFESYPQLRALAVQLGISFVADVSVSAMNDGDLGPTQYRLTQQQLVSFYSQPENRRFAQVQRRLPAGDDSLCGIGQRGCVIGPFGDVYACMGHQQAVGNVRESRFSQIWKQSAELERLRTLAARDLAVCGSCEKFAYCNRCAATALSDDGDFLGPSAWSCHLAAAKEKAAGLEVKPSAAERLELVTVVAREDQFALELPGGDSRPPVGPAAVDSGAGGCSSCAAGALAAALGQREGSVDA